MPKAKLIELSFSSMADLDQGTLNSLLAWHLQCVMRDLKSRPWEKKARLVTFTLNFTPRLNAMGDLSKVALAIAAKHKLPIHQTEVYEVAASDKGFVVNADFPSELDS